jgi:hypothetical protein
MPTRQRQQNAPQEQPVPLHEGAPAVGYAAETLRRYWWLLPEDDRPPLIKRRGRWMVVPSELAAWAYKRSDAGQAAS